jgi:hypothetical protein
LAALALISFCLHPALASAAIVQKWKTPNGTVYAWVAEVSGDLNGDGSFEMVTQELASGGVFKIGIRSGSTGALLAQTTTTYVNPDGFWYADVDASGDAEILFTDAKMNLVCLHYSGSSLTVRFNYVPTPTGVPVQWDVADLDGNGHLYFIFRDETNNTPTSNNYYVRDYNGALTATINPAGAPVPATRQLWRDDYDSDGRQEFMIQYTSVSGNDVLYIYESNAPGPLQPASFGTPTLRRADPVEARRPIEPVYVRESR